MKSGYLYVLVHPSDPDLYKIGVTVLKPEKRLAQHNSQHDKYAGKIVKETGQKWELKTFIPVPDPYFAEAVFWETMPLAPFQRGSIEVIRLDPRWVEAGLEAARKAGLRPVKVRLFGPVRNSEWMVKQLEGTGIAIVGRYRGLVRGTDFQCEKGHEFTESAGVVANRKSCPLCGTDYRAPWRRVKGSQA
jgi:hypothetical protein